MSYSDGDSTGHAVVNDWIEINGSWYYFDADGRMVTGTQTIGGKTYKFGSDGKLAAQSSGNAPKLAAASLS